MNYFLFFLHFLILIVPIFIFYNLDQASIHHKNSNFLTRPYGFFVFFKADLFKKISHIKMGYEWTFCIILRFILYVYLIGSHLYFIPDIGLKFFFTIIVLLFVLVLIKASFYNLDYYLLEKFLKEFDVNVINGKATLEDYQKLSIIGKKLAYNILCDNKNFKLILEHDAVTRFNDNLDTKLTKKESTKEKVQKI